MTAGNEPQNHRIQSRSVSFAGYQGNKIAATLDFPGAIEPDQYAIISHCFTCTRQTLTTARVSRGLAQAGIAVLRFDFTGLGESEGDFAESHFRSMLQDIRGAAAFLEKHFRPVSLLLGHSMGGTASLAASQAGFSELQRLLSVITLASPASPAHVLHHFGPAMDELERGQPAEIWVAGKAYPVRPSFVEDVRSFDMQEQMRDCELPLMAVRAAEDELVDVGAAESILAYTRGETRLCHIEAADHLFSQREHTLQAIEQILDWIASLGERKT